MPMERLPKELDEDEHNKKRGKEEVTWADDEDIEFGQMILKVDYGENLLVCRNGIWKKRDKDETCENGKYRTSEATLTRGKETEFV